MRGAAVQVVTASSARGVAASSLGVIGARCCRAGCSVVAVRTVTTRSEAPLFLKSEISFACMDVIQVGFTLLPYHRVCDYVKLARYQRVPDFLCFR